MEENDEVKTSKATRVVFCEEIGALVDAETGERISLVTKHQANIPVQLEIMENTH